MDIIQELKKQIEVLEKPYKEELKSLYEKIFSVQHQRENNQKLQELKKQQQEEIIKFNLKKYETK